MSMPSADGVSPKYASYTKNEWNTFLTKSSYRGSGIKWLSKHFSKGECVYNKDKNALIFTSTDSKGKSVIKEISIEKIEKNNKKLRVSHWVHKHLFKSKANDAFKKNISSLSEKIAQSTAPESDPVNKKETEYSVSQHSDQKSSSESLSKTKSLSATTSREESKIESDPVNKKETEYSVSQHSDQKSSSESLSRTKSSSATKSSEESKIEVDLKPAHLEIKPAATSLDRDQILASLTLEEKKWLETLFVEKYALNKLPLYDESYESGRFPVVLGMTDGKPFIAVSLRKNGKSTFVVFNPRDKAGIALWKKTYPEAKFWPPTQMRDSDFLTGLNVGEVRLDDEVVDIIANVLDKGNEKRLGKTWTLGGITYLVEPEEANESKSNEEFEDLKVEVKTPTKQELQLEAALGLLKRGNQMLADRQNTSPDNKNS